MSSFIDIKNDGACLPCVIEKENKQNKNYPQNWDQFAWWCLGRGIRRVNGNEYVFIYRNWKFHQDGTISWCHIYAEHTAFVDRSYEQMAKFIEVMEG